MRKLFCFTLAVLGLAVSATSEESLPTGRDFGAGLTLTTLTALGDVVASPESHAETPILVRGRLTDLCTKKGCWTVLSQGDAVVRVRFHEYGFFLPKDALGATALVEGIAEVRVLSEREARHYASESRDGDAAAIEGPQREVSFVATGVRLLSER